MSAYVALLFVSGPVIHLGSGSGPVTLGRDGFGWIVSAFLAWRVTRGGHISRMLLLVSTLFICFLAAAAVVLRGTPAAVGVLAAGGAQAAALLSPAVRQRTRPGVASGSSGPAAAPRPRQRRGPRWLVMLLAAAAAFGLTGSAVASAAITERVANYNTRTVHLRAGGPFPVTLAQGRYFAFVRCSDYVGCPLLSPRQLTVRGPGRIVVTDVSFSGAPDMRSDSGQQFMPAAAFTLPASERVLISLRSRAAGPVLVEPSEQEQRFLTRWIEVAVASGLVLLAALILARQVR